MFNQPCENRDNKNSETSADVKIISAYLDAVGDASRRSRITLIIMVTASVLSFAGFWNSSQMSWLAKRIQVARNAYNWFHFQDDTSELNQNIDPVL